METIKYSLVFLHLFIAIFNIHNANLNLFKPKEKQVIDVAAFANEIFRICLYHGACILVIWFSRPSKVNLVRVTALVLVCELIEISIVLIQFGLMFNVVDWHNIVYSTIDYFLTVSAVALTILLIDKLKPTDSKLLKISFKASTEISHFDAQDNEPVAV